MTGHSENRKVGAGGPGADKATRPPSKRPEVYRDNPSPYQPPERLPGPPNIFKCRMCGERLTEPGALLIGVPFNSDRKASSIGLVNKSHLCARCSEVVETFVDDACRAALASDGEA